MNLGLIRKWLPPALRVLAIGLLVVQVHGVGTSQRPDLLQPTDIGSDSSNYYAAGLRLNAGHPLYGPLSASDRPVPGYPGGYPAPLLSPPLIAVVWRPLAVLPDDLGIAIWWTGGVVLIAAIFFWMIVRGTTATLLILNGVLLLQVPIALYMQRFNVPHAVLMGWFSPVATGLLSGNLNTYIVGLLVLTWWATVRSRAGLGGGASALGAALKLGPAIMVGWLLGQGGRRAIVALVAVGAVLGVVGLIGAGISANVAYLHVAMGGGISPTRLSLPVILNHFLHIKVSTTSYVLPVVILGGIVGAWLLRSYPRAAFATAIVAMIFSSPVVMPGNLILLMAIATPGEIVGPRPSRTAPTSNSPIPVPNVPGPKADGAAGRYEGTVALLTE